MNGIDFLKACTTNVRSVEGLLDWQYIQYTCNDNEAAEETIRNAVTDLRRRDIVCSGQPSGLWVFARTNGMPSGSADHGQQRFDVQETGLIRDASPEALTDEVRIEDVLLHAVEGSISYMLATGYGMLHIGSFQWLLKPAESNSTPTTEDSTIVRLHPRWTENGSLCISTTTRASSLHSLNATTGFLSGDVILAPSGVRAKLRKESVDDDRSLATSPTTHTIRGTIWKQSIVDVLLAECIGVELDEEWSVVELLEKNQFERFIWPTRLCLTARSSAGFDAGNKPSEDPGWQYWFDEGFASQDAFENHLELAEKWFSSAAEREVMAAENSGAGPPTVDTAMTASSIVAETPMATSPPFNQRLIDQQAALAGIYPTPPDGLAPGHLIHPTSDSLSSAMQVDTANPEDDAELPVVGDHVGRGNSMESVREGPSYQPHSDDLFGDMTEMDFGTNEVGDEDFDYFDEPDDEVGTGGTSHDADMADHILQEEVDIAVHPSEAAESPRLDLKPDHGESEGFEAEQASRDAIPSSQPLEPQHREVPASDGMVAQTQTFAIPKLPRPIEKPLSPFGIKERLLPPPIPASVLSNDGVSSQPDRRRSTFDAVQFNQGLALSEKYTSMRTPSAAEGSMSGPNISLPTATRKERSDAATEPNSADTDMESSSEDGSYDSMTSISDDDNLPPKLPWQTKKRKRTSVEEQQFDAGEEHRSRYDEALSVDGDDTIDARKIRQIADAIFGKTSSSMTTTRTIRDTRSQGTTAALNLDVLDLGKAELMYIAQYVCEQATSSTTAIKLALENANQLHDATGSGTHESLTSIANNTLDHIFASMQDLGLAKLALIKEPPPRPNANPGKAPASGQPRMPYREGSMQLGPDWFPLPPPYVRIQRGADNWEMLPPAVNFWNALSFGPSNGVKDITAVFVAPNNTDFLDTARGLMKDLASTYEGCKLGQFELEPDLAFVSIASDDDDGDQPCYENGIVHVGDALEELSLGEVMQDYKSLCEQVGLAIESLGRERPERTTVICIVDPFEDEQSTQFLCACFWRLLSFCRTSTHKAYKTASRSDIVLQIIPVSLIASRNGLVVLDNVQLSSVAMEIYDRCPPSTKAAAAIDLGSALPILAAPAIELSAGPPKRIAFQLSAEPPSDLLHENSILHLAYALSPDRQWLTICWLDNTGRYQMTTTTCLRGRSFKDAASEIWERTAEIIAARQVTWRVFIVAPADVEPSIQRCWKTLAASKVKKQMLHVTLLSVDDEPTIHLMPPVPAEGSNATSQQAGQGFLTPVSTPQGGSMTVSPEASGQPSTPAISEAPTTAVETDPDAHLVDVADESWGVLLSSASASNPSTASTAPAPIAKGLLLRRGNTALTGSSGSDKPLDALAVSLHWDIRVRPGGAVDEGPTRQAEMTLREVLRMYRNLGLLGRMRHLGSEGEGGEDMRPLHVACAEMGAEALDGLLGSAA